MLQYAKLSGMIKGRISRTNSFGFHNMGVLFCRGFLNLLAFNCFFMWLESKSQVTNLLVWELWPIHPGTDQVGNPSPCQASNFKEQLPRWSSFFPQSSSRMVKSRVALVGQRSSQVAPLISQRPSDATLDSGGGNMRPFHGFSLSSQDEEMQNWNSPVCVCLFLLMWDVLKERNAATCTCFTC